MSKSEKSKKRSKYLFVLIILTAILSITTTYTWFSARRDVEISNLEVNVEAAKDMQISLDGEHWKQSITISDMAQLYGTVATEGTIQAKAGDNYNYVPTAMIPASSVGEVENGKLQLVTGTISGKTLSGITLCSEADITAEATVTTKEGNNSKHPYLVFDLYLKNMSEKATDSLYLKSGSRVFVGDNGTADTGVEYSSRVAFVPYSTTADLMASGEAVRDIVGVVADTTAVIWEPNHLHHTAYLVANNDRGINAQSQEFETYGVTADAAGQTVSDITVTSDPLLAKQTVLTPAYDLANGTTADQDLGITIAGDKISKVRVYFWLEGQDPDCVDNASLGKEIAATIKLEKGE